MHGHTSLAISDIGLLCACVSSSISPLREKGCKVARIGTGKAIYPDQLTSNPVGTDGDFGNESAS